MTRGGAGRTPEDTTSTRFGDFAGGPAAAREAAGPGLSRRPKKRKLIHC